MGQHSRGGGWSARLYEGEAALACMSNMGTQILVVAVGGTLGTICRFGLSFAVVRIVGGEFRVTTIFVALLSCQSKSPTKTDPAPEPEPEVPAPAAAKFVVWAAITPAPGQTDFAPFGDWKPFSVSTNLSRDLNPLRVMVNPPDLARSRVLEIAHGYAPAADYCANGAEWGDYRTIWAGQTLYLAACETGQGVVVVQTSSQTRLDTLYFEVTAEPTTDPTRFNIELVFVEPSEWTAAQKGVFEQAAQRWEDIITADIPDSDLSQPGWSFDSRDHKDWWISSDRYDLLGRIRVDDAVDDLRVFVGRPLSDEDDLWGVGSPLWRRGDSNLPILASINIHGLCCMKTGRKC